jgi:hypothetical protein
MPTPSYIATADGQVYEDEFSLSLGRAMPIEERPALPKGDREDRPYSPFPKGTYNPDEHKGGENPIDLTMPDLGEDFYRRLGKQKFIQEFLWSKGVDPAPYSPGRKMEDEPTESEKARRRNNAELPSGDYLKSLEKEMEAFPYLLQEANNFPEFAKIYKQDISDSRNIFLPITSNKPSEEELPNSFEVAAARQKASVRPREGRGEGGTTKVLSEYLPHAINQMATLPERVTQASETMRTTGVYDPGPAVETALALYGANAPFIKPGSLGIFGGKGAYLDEWMGYGSPDKNVAFQNRLTNYHKMKERNISDDLAFELTGVYKGHEGELKFEIPDAQGKLSDLYKEKAKEALDTPLSWEQVPGDVNVTGLKKQFHEGKLDDLLEHKELYDAYPWLSHVYIKVLKDDPKTSYGGWASYNDKNPTKSVIAFKEEYLKNPEALRKLLLHEVQHLVQGYEGFAKGASYMQKEPLITAFDEEVNALAAEVEPIRLKVLKRLEGDKSVIITKEEKDKYLFYDKVYNTFQKFKEAAEELGRLNYYRTAGEVESRNVEKRSAFSKDQIRRIKPDSTEAYLPEDQIISKEVELYNPFDKEGKAKNMDPDLVVKY